MDEGAVLERIKRQVGEGRYRLTRHAVEEGITLTEILEALQTAILVENYPEHRRGPCCLLSGTTGAGRAIHVVCTTALELLVIITVYKPKSAFQNLFCRRLKQMRAQANCRKAS